MDQVALKLMNDAFKFVHSPFFKQMGQVAAMLESKDLHTLALRADQLMRIGEQLHPILKLDLRPYHSVALEAFERLDAIDKRLSPEIQKAVRLSQRTLPYFENTLASPVIAAISEIISQHQDLNKTFLFDIAEEIRGFADGVEQEQQERSIDTLRDSIVEKASNLPISTMSFEGMLNLIIALVALLYAIHVSRQSTQADEYTHLRLDALAKRIQKLPDELIPRLLPLLSNQADSILYIVERKSLLYLSPSSKSTVIGTLYPNQDVQLILRKHKWIYVQYFDYLNGIPKNGWVLKKYLRIVSR